MSIESKKELEALREAGRIVRAALEAMRRKVRPGIATAELDAIRLSKERVVNFLRTHGAGNDAYPRVIRKRFRDRAAASVS